MSNDSVFTILRILQSREMMSSDVRFCYIFKNGDLLILFSQAKKHLLVCKDVHSFFVHGFFNLEQPITSVEASVYYAYSSTVTSTNFFYLIILICSYLFWVSMKSNYFMITFNKIHIDCRRFCAQLLHLRLNSNWKVGIRNFFLIFYGKEILNFVDSLEFNYVNVFLLTPSRWLDRLTQYFREIFYGQGVEKDRNLEKSTVDISPHLTYLAHELKLPLFNIKSFLETLYEYNFRLTEGQRLEFLETANKEANRLVHLIDNILALQALRSVSVQEWYLPETFNMMEIILQVINSYALLSGNKEVQCLYNVTPICFYSYGNPDLIAQVINNLVGNSLKYTFPRKKILIRTRSFTSFSSHSFRKQTKLQVCILDQGVGISNSSIYGKFDPHKSKKKSRIHPRIIGNGLGLNIVRQVLLYHQSPLCILSRIHKGSAVSFTLFSGMYNR